jgi:hypothetical protein
MEGRTEGRKKELRTEGIKDGRTEEKTEGRKGKRQTEGRKEKRKDGWTDGRKEGSGEVEEVKYVEEGRKWGKEDRNGRKDGRKAEEGN